MPCRCNGRLWWFFFFCYREREGERSIPLPQIYHLSSSYLFSLPMNLFFSNGGLRVFDAVLSPAQGDWLRAIERGDAEARAGTPGRWRVIQMAYFKISKINWQQSANGHRVIYTHVFILFYSLLFIKINIHWLK